MRITWVISEDGTFTVFAEASEHRTVMERAIQNEMDFIGITRIRPYLAIYFWLHKGSMKPEIDCKIRSNSGYTYEVHLVLYRSFHNGSVLTCFREDSECSVL